jgi:hypothetical protein
MGQRITSRNALLLFLSCLWLLALLGCEVGTSVTIEGGPSFSFGGSGRLVSFNVYAPEPGHRIATPLDAKALVWSIEPVSSSPSGAFVTGMSLVYGKVPTGYVQKVPNSGAAGRLISGQVYYFVAEATGASGSHGFFYVDKNGPIPIDVPGLCPNAFIGDVKPVKCGTNEPYVEPKDLEEFVRENRVKK